MAAKLKPWAAAVLSGLALAMAFPPLDFWPLAWVALVPLLWAAVGASRAKEAANLGAVAGLVFYGLSLSWMTKLFGPMGAAFWCVFALWVALFCAAVWRLWRWMEERPSARRALAWAALAAAFWTGLEYFRSEIWWLNNSWLGLGFSQAENPALLQSCGLWGVYGLSALIVFVNAGLFLLVKGRRAPAAVGLGLVLVAAVYGFLRLQGGAAPTLRVALVQDESGDPARLAALSQAHAREAKLLVWPEYALWVQEGREAEYKKFLAQKLKGLNAVSVVGAFIHGEMGKKKSVQNFAWVIGPDGVWLGRYDKLHPIPYVEKSLKPNPTPRPVDTPLGRLGIQICYDLDFQDGARAVARQGAELLVVPNIDPESWGERQHLQHSAMAPVRAVETGLWIARAASSGISQIIDDRGRVRASLGFGISGVLAGDVALGRGRTVYLFLGWLTGPLCLGITVILLAAMVIGAGGEANPIRRFWRRRKTTGAGPRG